jgi:hypothetical protein
MPAGPENYQTHLNTTNAVSVTAETAPAVTAVTETVSETVT